MLTIIYGEYTIEIEKGELMLDMDSIGKSVRTSAAVGPLVLTKFEAMINGGRTTITRKRLQRKPSND